ncbi:MAG: hypothetical protein HC846_07375 [Blastocatellia bacterium]|nr:hypothetical protein [Blastocatellia bacterium]
MFATANVVPLPPNGSSTKSPLTVDSSMTLSRIFVDSAFALRASDLNLRCRTGGMSVQTSFRLTPFGFMAWRCPP